MGSVLYISTVLAAAFALLVWSDAPPPTGHRYGYCEALGLALG